MQEFKDLHNKFHARDLSVEEFQRIIGYTLMGAGSGTYPQKVVTQGAKFFTTPSNSYYVGDETNLWNVYNGFTQVLTDGGNALDTPDQTLKLTKRLLSFN